MKKGAGLIAVWLMILVPLTLHVNRGKGDDARVCGNCYCAEAKAWGHREKTSHAEVLTTYDKDNPTKFGTPVTTAQKYESAVPFCVFAKDCLKDNYQKADEEWYSKWTYDNNAWARSCTIPDGAGACYYAWVPLDYAPGGNPTQYAYLVRRYTCGPQN